MDKLLLVADRPPERFEIVDDGGGDGVLVFRYVGGANTHDYFQSDVLMAQRCAEQEWGVPASLWRAPQSGESPLG